MTPAQQPAPSQQRFGFIQALRGTAAILVVWAHLSGFWLLTTGNSSSLQSLWQEWIAGPFHIFQNGGHLAVVLFFLISGYIITHTSLREGYKAFAVKRLMRIFPTLAVATVFAWLMLQVARITDTTLYGINDGGLTHWISSAALLDGVVSQNRALDVTWTLVIEMLFYAATFVLLTVSRRTPLRATWYMLLGWLAVSLVGMNGYVPGINGTLGVYVGWLVVGRFIYLAHQGLIPVADALVGSAFALLFFFLFMETLEPGYLIAPGGWKGIEPLVTYTLAVLVFVGCVRWSPARIVWPLAFLGDISYSLYLIHLPVGITVLNLLKKAGSPDSVNVVVALVASVLVAWGSYIVIEKPSQRLARRMLRRWGNTAATVVPQEA